MYRTLLTAVRAEASGARALETIRALGHFHRIQASPGYDAAAAWMADAIVDAGLEPVIERVPGDGRTRALGILLPRGWVLEHGHASLRAAGGRELLCDAEAEPLAVIQRSAPLAGVFPLVAVPAGGGTAADYAGVDVRGKIVLTDAPVHAVLAHAVIERGAAGILTYGRRLFPPVRAAHDDEDALPYTSFWWTPAMPRGAGFVVSPATGRRLAAQLAAGQALELEADLASREYDTRIPLLSASIPGRGAEEILLLAHLCHPQPGANDNASGAAALLEAARVLEALRRSGAWTPGERGVRFLWMPELCGTAAWLGLDRERARRTVAALNLDMVGADQMQCGSTLLVEDPPCFNASFAEALLRAIRRDAQDWITSYAGPGHFSMMRLGEVPYGGGSDHAVLGDPLVGVPCPMLIQWPDRYYHSSHDTPDRCDPDSLALAVRCAATYAGALAALDAGGVPDLVERVGRDARRRVLEAAGRDAAPHGVTRAMVAGRAALASLARLADEPARIAAALARFDEFCAAEGAPPPPPPPRGLRAEATPAAACFRRRVAGPLEFLNHLLPGYDALDAEARPGLDALIAGLPGGRATLDVAWAAADGRRNLEEVAAAVRVETGLDVAVAAPADGAATGLLELFTMLERLGLVSRSPETEVRWNLGAPDTVTS